MSPRAAAIVRLLAGLLRLALWFTFCVGLVILLGGPLLLGIVIASGLAFVTFPTVDVPVADHRPNHLPPGSRTH